MGKKKIPIGFKVYEVDDQDYRYLMDQVHKHNKNVLVGEDLDYAYKSTLREIENSHTPIIDLDNMFSL